MRISTWLIAPAKKLFLLLTCFVITSHMFLFYLAQCTPSKLTYGYWGCIKTNSSMVTDSQNHLVISRLLKKSHETNFRNNSDKLIMKSSRDCNYAKVNLTTCPDCLSSEVRNIQSSLQKITFLNNLIPDTPADFFKTKLEIVQNLVTDYVIVPNISCPYLIALQLSLLDRHFERDIIRETWGSVAKHQTWPKRKINADVKVVFVVARQNTTNNNITTNIVNSSINNTLNQETDIYLEAATHGDILFINMDDTYRNLTLKILSAFKWVKDSCSCVQFVLKVDFDTFVNVPLLLDALLFSENRLEFSILGMVYTGKSYVSRDGPWGVNSTLYPMNSFPEYASGCGYVLTYKALSKIVETVPYFPMFSVEDAFVTGVMRRVANIHLYSLGSWFTHYGDKFWNSCVMIHDKKVLGTSDAGKRHRELWEMFVKNSC